jgi:Rrf2 family transcriptional regulator, nitric oxide-sensitive transcriptional repressor
MRLTNFTDYTLRTLIYLGTHQKDEQLATIGDIANGYGVSENHLMKVVHHLAKLGYITTTRGKGGGMRLACAPETINIGEVVRSTEGALAIVECFQAPKDHCAITPACTLREILAEAMQAFFEVLDGYTLEHLLQNQAELKALLPNT